VVLRNINKFIELLDIDLKTGEYRSFIKNNSDLKDSSGQFCLVNNEVFGLGVDSGRFFLVTAGRVSEVSGDIQTKIEFRENCRYFSVVNTQGLISETEYKPETAGSYLTYTEDDEDVDCLLWIHNILNSPERMQILLDSNDT